MLIKKTLLPRNKGILMEDFAVNYLQQKGLKLLTRNYYCKIGEIDAIYRNFDDSELIFVEVRYRQNTDYGLPEETVTYSKQKKLINTAKYFFLVISWAAELFIRFDVLSITSTLGALEVNCLQDVITEN